MGLKKALAIVAPLLMALGGVQAQKTVEPIVMKGTKFFFKNGTQFFIKGVAYQQQVQAGGATSASASYTDPLADETLCKRDVPLLAALGTNMIRTYAIDPTKDHSACMKLLQAAGIYVVSDLSEPSVSINRDSPVWNTALYARYTAVVDEMSKYDNVFGFFAGNEVSNNASNTGASAYVKAAVRDTKNYIKSKNLGRWMGVGYAANDDKDIRENIAHYFNCGNQDEAIDYWGFNIYEWCGHSTFKTSGYEEQTKFFQSYSVPVFFAEYGCNTQGGAEGRIWEETTALYSDDMTPVFSGGIVYMYFQEANDYGIVQVDKSGSAKPMKNYQALSARVAAATPALTPFDSYTPSNQPAACPAVGNVWHAAASPLPPTPNNTVCECMYSSLSCVPSSSLSNKKYGDVFGTICGYPGNLCEGINANETTGSYGVYSMCNDTQKLGYVLNAYYKQQKSDNTACSFGGAAEVVTPKSSDGSCKAALASATSGGLTAGNGSGSGSSSGGSSATSSSFAVPVPMPGWRMGWGDVYVGVYLVVAMGIGAGTLLL